MVFSIGGSLVFWMGGRVEVQTFGDVFLRTLNSGERKVALAIGNFRHQKLSLIIYILFGFFNPTYSEFW